jgi:hypothetical protein
MELTEAKETVMPRAVLKNGVIYPIEPLPEDWQDGLELRVEKSTGEKGKSTNQWMNEVEASAAKIPRGEDDKLVAAIADLRRQAKALASKGKR